MLEKKCLSFWKNFLEPVPWIISCIRGGCKLPLQAIPSKCSKVNQCSALDHKEFVWKSLQDLEKHHCIIRVFETPHVCSPLFVVENNIGKLRLVLNLCYLNQFLWLYKFKYEDLRIAVLVLQKENHVFS